MYMTQNLTTNLRSCTHSNYAQQNNQDTSSSERSPGTRHSGQYIPRPHIDTFIPDTYKHNADGFGAQENANANVDVVIKLRSALADARVLITEQQEQYAAEVEESAKLTELVKHLRAQLEESQRRCVCVCVHVHKDAYACVKQLHAHTCIHTYMTGHASCISENFYT
jgi:hypothetical protein